VDVLKIQRRDGVAEDFDGVQFTILADLYLHMKDYMLQHVHQIVVTMSFTPATLVDLLGREAEVAILYIWWLQFLCYFHSKHISKLSCLIACLEHVGLSTAATSLCCIRLPFGGKIRTQKDSSCQPPCHTGRPYKSTTAAIFPHLEPGQVESFHRFLSPLFPAASASNEAIG